MTTVTRLASRRAAPIVPTVNAVHPTRASSAHTPTLTGAEPADLVHLHMAAVNALSHALRQLTGPDCSPAMWAAATARARRGLTALKRAHALVQMGEV